MDDLKVMSFDYFNNITTSISDTTTSTIAHPPYPLNYKFPPPLTTAQLADRREQLDLAGLQAFLLPLILLLTVQTHRQFISIKLSQNANDTSSSNIFTRILSLSQSVTRRVSWFLGWTPSNEFGSLQVRLLSLSYGAALLYIITKDAGDDYMHLTKAFAHVAISQLPIHFLLSLKSHKYNPITYATGLTHERLNTYHRHLGRAIYALLACHATLYLNFFYQIGVLQKRLGDTDVRLGLAAFATINVLAGLAMPGVRAKFYHVLFYRSHVLLSITLVGIVWFHIPYWSVRAYLAQAGVAWMINGMLRKREESRTTVKCTAVGIKKHTPKDQVKDKDVGLIDVRIQLTDEKQGEKWQRDWIEGMHGYLNQSGLGPRNPFTIVSVQNSTQAPGKKEIRLMVRDLGGPTTSLLSHAAANNKPLSNLTLEGPYGEASEYLPTMLHDVARGTSGKILLVAGGIGASYTLPIYTALVRAGNGPKQCDTTSNISLIWIVKNARDVSWGLPLLQELHCKVNVQVMITGQDQQRKDEDVKAFGLDCVEGLTFSVRYSSPNLGVDVDEVFEAGSTAEKDGKKKEKKMVGGGKEKEKEKEKVTVLVCGPPGLAADLRKEVGRHVYKYGRDVAWYEEQFGFGGS